MSKFTPPFLGAAYYPEAWPLEQFDDDINLMKQAGMTVMRIGEFAWSRMEPEEGRYDLDWLHLAVDKLANAGIATIIGTPTCTPPAWLTSKHPEILPVMDDGRRVSHGERHHRCPNVPIYREYSGRIVSILADAFGHDENVIGWQIDNEIHPNGRRGCCCDFCHAKFHRYLADRFDDVATLNAAWGTDLWSQTYDRFDQIPVPITLQRHHPSLIAAWMEFQSDSIAEYVALQATILHERATQPVGTDMMPTQVLDWKTTHDPLDIVQFNHYNTPENLAETVLWMDFSRTLLNAPWWCTETSTCWNGGTSANGYREPGFCRANSWLPIALGGEANLYWLWRSHWSGQELMHGSVIQSCGRPLHIFDEVREVADGFRAAAGFLNDSRPVATGLALHLSGDAWHVYHQQSMTANFAYKERLTRDFHGPLMSAHYRTDVIDPAADLTPYRLVLSPYLPSLEEDDVGKRALDWVRGGGTWTVGPLSDIRTRHATKYGHAPLGHLEKWTGVRSVYQIPSAPRDFAYRWADDTETTGSVWYDAYEAPDIDTLATYTEGPMAGLAAVTRTAIGNGSIVILGTTPHPEDLVKLVDTIAPETGVNPVAGASPNVLVVPRSGDAGEGLVAVEVQNQPARVALDRPGYELLSEEHVEGTLELNPYAVAVVRYND